MKVGVVLFSGGVDSTYIVAKSVRDFDKLILNTYKVPGMINVENSEKSFRQLKKKYGDKVVHNIIDISDFIRKKRGGFYRCIADNFRYKFFYSWCLGCKIGMHMYTIDFCKKHGIRYALDGSNYYDVHALEQHEDVKMLLDSIYKRNGINFISPYYYEDTLQNHKAKKASALMKHLSLHKDSTKYRIKYLKNKGFDLGRGFFSQYRSTQPSCTVSVFFNVMRLPLKLISKEEAGQHTIKYGYLNYIADKVYEYKNNENQGNLQTIKELRKVPKKFIRRK